MKDIFFNNNYTKNDIAKKLFKEQWMRTAVANRNEADKKVVMRTSTMQGGGGMPYPGLSKPIYVAEEDTEEKI